MDTQDKDRELASPEMVRSSTVPPLDRFEIVADTPVPGELFTTPLAKNEGRKETLSPLRESLGRLRRDKRAMVSLGLIVLFILIPLLGPLIYQHIGGTYHSSLNGSISASIYHNPFHQELDRQDEFISGQYWLGTDVIGRDLLARLMQGMLVSLFVALVVEIVDIGLGILVGVLAGYYGGWIDQLLARFTDLMFAFPGLLFAIMITGIFGGYADTYLSSIPLIGANGNSRLILVSLALAFTAWPMMARYVRGQTLQIKEQQFIEAAHTAGTSDLRIIWRHIIPNLFSIVVVAATLDIANTVIGEAGLSLLGLGVQQPGSSIGLMISDGFAVIENHPWEVFLPSLILTAIVLAFSFLGDGLRDAFDPRSTS
ncbi:MAG TPA: ABC transporter permease [Ktedonobacteraceae bacterium]